MTCLLLNLVPRQRPRVTRDLGTRSRRDTHGPGGERAVLACFRPDRRENGLRPGLVPVSKGSVNASSWLLQSCAEERELRRRVQIFSQGIPNRLLLVL